MPDKLRTVSYVAEPAAVPLHPSGTVGKLRQDIRRKSSRTWKGWRPNGAIYRSTERPARVQRRRNGVYVTTARRPFHTPRQSALLQAGGFVMAPAGSIQGRARNVKLGHAWNRLKRTFERRSRVPRRLRPDGQMYVHTLRANSQRSAKSKRPADERFPVDAPPTASRGRLVQTGEFADYRVTTRTRSVWVEGANRQGEPCRISLTRTGARAAGQLRRLQSGLYGDGPRLTDFVDAFA